MPVTPTYPGVYIEEIPSGVRTITGVSTSVTAFVGAAKRGPINRAVHILSYSDFERRFGGLDANSEMSYSVRQFFLNGGSDAWVVRLAQNVSPAHQTLISDLAENVLEVTAIDEGKAGNFIEVRIDYLTPNPASNFNLTLVYVSPDNPSDSVTERFENLSINSFDGRYVENIVNGSSQLVTVQRVHNLSGLTEGTSTSGQITNPASLVDATHNQFRVSVNGLPPVTVQLTAADVSGGTPLETLRAAIETKLKNSLASTPELNNLTVTNPTSTTQLVIHSGVPGEKSSVRVMPGVKNDISAALKFGTLNGGTETDAVARIRPREIALHGTLTSNTFGATDLNTIPDGSNNTFTISLDGEGPDNVVLDPVPASGADLEHKLADVAARIEAKVRALKPALLAYKNFTCAAINDSGNRKLRLSSGTRGTGSSVVVGPGATNDISTELHLTGVGVNSTLPLNVMLAGGNDDMYTDANVYNAFIASRADRKGLYALESVDLFNILCLPGITDSGILMDADSYCQERRAFLIVDAKKGLKPDAMVTQAQGAALPKSDHAAVYYPWIKIADPLNNGKLRTCAPSGTIAGLYARTDSTRGVWKAPAGTDANLFGAQGVDYILTDGENGTLNPLGVNVIRLMPVFGAVAWGARTLRGANEMASEYKYIPVRRLALFIEETLYRGTKWVVFEPNDEPLWGQIRLNLGAFMNNLFRQGAFQGKSPREAYFVKCDKETTTQNDINQGVVNIIVGFAPLKPAEFVIIRIQQIAGQIET